MDKIANTMSKSVFYVLKPLPYTMNALMPFISEETLQFHYGKHHQSYLNNLNNLMSKEENCKLKGMSLEEIIRDYGTNKDTKIPVGIYNNAAQVWNHDFYWRSMCPPIQGPQQVDNLPNGKIKEEVEKSFGSYEEFREKFTQAAASRFGSGWAWLVKNEEDGKLEILTTSNGDNPLLQPGKRPLLTCDVWEHAYYIDYRNDRGKYLNNAWWKLINWHFANSNL